MPDLMQFKRGPFSNIDRVSLKQGEPAFLYDTKTFVIGTGDGNEPVFFTNERDLKILLSTIENNFNINISDHALKITNLETTSDTYANRISALEDKSVQKIKSSQLSTAVDADKIGLVNLKQEVISKINSGGGGTDGGMTEIIPGSIGFDLLSTEVNEMLDNDFGSY